MSSSPIPSAPIAAAKSVGFGKRVAPGGRRVGVAGERRVEVDEDGAGDVARVVGGAARAAVEVPAAVGEDDRRREVSRASDRSMDVDDHGRRIPTTRARSPLHRLGRWTTRAHNRERMLAGDLYIADDPSWPAAMRRGTRLADEFNALAPRDREAARAVLAELLGGLGEETVVRAPLYVDYGEHLTIGARTFVNFGLVALDVAPIAIGDDCQLGPNVQLLDRPPPDRAGAAPRQARGRRADHDRRQRLARRRRDRPPRRDDRRRQRDRRGRGGDQGRPRRSPRGRQPGARRATSDPGVASRLSAGPSPRTARRVRAWRVPTSSPSSRTSTSARSPRTGPTRRPRSKPCSPGWPGCRTRSTRSSSPATSPSYGKRKEYRLARELLDATGVPVHVMPGNHDDRAKLREAFDAPRRGRRADRLRGRPRPAAPWSWSTRPRPARRSRAASRSRS